jgi:hypothetical protein
MGTINLVMRSPEDNQQIANSQARPGELFAGGSNADRDKESLVSSDASLADKAKGFLDFLNTTKEKPAPVATPTTLADNGEQTWSMRVLKPGDVQEVEFEGEPNKDANGSPSMVWKASSSVSTGGAAAAKSAPKPDEPRPPKKKQPEKDKKDQSAS